MLNRLSTARVACYFRPLSAPTNEDLAEGEKVTELGAAANVTLAAGKVGIGVFGNSAALVADGIHSLGDLLSDGVTYFCLQRSHLPSSERHPYGHGRVDSLGALGVAALLGATSASVGVSAITDLYAAYQGTVESVPSVWCAVAAGVSVGIKEYLFQQTKRVAARTRSQALMANAWHHRSDAYSSVAALLGAGGAMFLGVPMLDSAGALVVSGMLMKTAYETGARAALELVDADVNPVLRKQVEELLVETRSHVGHVGHHDLRVRASGPFNFVDVHVEVPPRISVSEAHWIADTVRLEVMSKFEEVRECLVHVDAEEDSEAEKSREKIIEAQLLSPPEVRSTVLECWNAIEQKYELELVEVVTHVSHQEGSVEVRLRPPCGGDLTRVTHVATLLRQHVATALSQTSPSHAPSLHVHVSLDIPVC